MQYYNPESDTYCAAGAAFVLGEIQYPANWLDLATADDIAAIGLQPVTIVGERQDDAYYDNAESLSGGARTITSTPKPIETIKADKRAAIAASRYALETAGIMVNGAPVDTDRQSQAMVSGALLTVTRNPQATINWKSPSGFVQLDAAGIGAIADAVSAHVQACFTAEANKVAALDALTAFADVVAFDTSVSLVAN